MFGEEPSKPLLLDFLNELLREEGNITELTYIKNENYAEVSFERKAIFRPLLCKREREKFIEKNLIFPLVALLQSLTKVNII